jgi:His/Glu/Gln/Arg/opine family amino acid ABC transporter permease subunit
VSGQSFAAAGYDFDWSVVEAYWEILIKALRVTFEVSIAAELLSLVLGLLLAFGRMHKSVFIRVPSIAFIDFFRAVPLLVLLIWLYYGVSLVLGITFSTFQAGVLGLGLMYAAFLAEIFRSGLEAVPGGQREAALTLGMSRRQTTRYIVLPQAIRMVVPALGNSYIGVLKDATLVSILGLNEIMRTAQNVVVTTFRPFEIYTFVALVYVVIVLAFGRLLAILERRAPIR